MSSQILCNKDIKLQYFLIDELWTILIPCKFFHKKYFHIHAQNSNCQYFCIMSWEYGVPLPSNRFILTCPLSTSSVYYLAWDNLPYIVIDIIDTFSSAIVNVVNLLTFTQFKPMKRYACQTLQKILLQKKCLPKCLSLGIWRSNDILQYSRSW